MYAIYMVTFTINIPPMLAYIPYMDPMGKGFPITFDYQSLWDIYQTLSKQSGRGIFFETSKATDRLGRLKAASFWDHKQTSETLIIYILCGL